MGLLIRLRARPDVVNLNLQELGRHNGIDRPAGTMTILPRSPKID
jgi:hypothetical protein